MPGRINPSFGDLGYWHLVEGAPDGPPIERAAWLEAQSRASSGPRPSPQVLKALALELAAHVAREGQPLPAPLLRAFAILLELPGGFLEDPVPVLRGRSGGRPAAHPAQRSVALRLDVAHLTKTGDLMPLNSLAARVAAELGITGKVSRASLKRWREDADYREELALARDRLLSKPISGLANPD